MGFCICKNPNLTGSTYQSAPVFANEITAPKEHKKVSQTQSSLNNDIKMSSKLTNNTLLNRSTTGMHNVNISNHLVDNKYMFLERSHSEIYYKTKCNKANSLISLSSIIIKRKPIYDKLTQRRSNGNDHN